MTSIHRCNVNDHNNQTTPAGRSEMFDYVVESKRRLDNAQKQLSGLQLAINVQNCEDNYINQ